MSFLRAMKKKISGCIKKFFKKLFSHILLSGEDFNSVVFQVLSMYRHFVLVAREAI